MYSKIAEALVGKSGQDIVIVGKGPSLDSVDPSLLNDCIVINTNDTEVFYPGDIAVFHHGWVLDLFDTVKPQCKLYISDRLVPGAKSQIVPEYVAYTPESADFMLNRFFSDKIYIEHAVIVSALRIANEIALQENVKKNVYLIGFDFTAKNGFTNRVPRAPGVEEPELTEHLISSQEQLLQMILAQKNQLNIQISHIGDKPYSVYSGQAFSQIFATRKAGSQYVKLEQTDRPEADHAVKVVAEITTNHFGDMDRLRTMIVAAKKAGADYVKLQKRDVESFYSDEKLSADYTSPFGTTFRDYRNGIELTEQQFEMVDDFCREIGIQWFASILDLPSYEFIKRFDPQLIKLPSTISEHTDYLTHVANDFTNDVVISTGYTDAAYEKFIFDTFKKARNIYLLQCTSAYPTPMEDTQLGVIRHYHNISQTNRRVIPGFSSHDIGSMCSMMSVAAGARMIEKHVKFGNVSWSHFDEVAVDMANGDFARLVADIRKAERIVGQETKVVQSSEHHKYWMPKS